MQNQPEAVVVRGVPSNRAGKAQQELTDIAIQLQKVVGAGMQVSTELAKEAIVRRGGKIPLIVQQAN